MESVVRDRLWLWGHDAGCHNDTKWGLPNPSRITPAEAAYYMGIPNLIMVRYLGVPPLPFDQYAIPLRVLPNVVWSIVGASGRSDAEERQHVLELAARNPNITGVMMDDFFEGSFEKQNEDEIAALSLDQLRELRSKLIVGDRRLTLWAVLYDIQLNKPLREYLDFLDKVSLWTLEWRKLEDLERNLEQVEKLAPKCDKVLGCYMWGYSEKKPMPLHWMKYQCELGLNWLKEGRIDGMIFLASCICDLELEAVNWTREWIREIADERLHHS